MHEKGFENIYLLTGGFDGFEDSFPELVIGKTIAKGDTYRASKAQSLIDAMNGGQGSGKKRYF